MKANLITVKNKPYYIVVLRWNDLETGERKTKWVTSEVPVAGNNKRKAEEKRLEILEEYRYLETEVQSLGKDILLIDYLELWIESQEISLAPVTFDTYSRIVRSQMIPFLKPMRLKLREATPAHIQKYVNFKLKSASPNTVIKHIWIFSKCFKSAVQQNFIPFNPVDRISKPKKVRYTGAKFLSKKQVDEVLEAFRGTPLEHIVLVAAFYGLRRSEVAGIKWDAVDFHKKTITIRHTVVEFSGKKYRLDTTKNKESYRTIPMPEVIESSLKTILEEQENHRQLQPNDYVESGYVFTKIDGTGICPDYISRTFKRILKENELPIVRFHDLRHTSASYLLSLGFNMKEIQAWLGHGNVTTTMSIYAHIDMTAKENLANTLNAKFLSSVVVKNG